MENWQVAAALERMAGLLALKGEKDFKVRAYSQAARQVIRTAEPLAALIEAGKLEQLPGIGPALARKITELVKSGRSEFLARLEAEVPSSLLALFSIPGVGYKTAATLVQKLQLQHVDQLEERRGPGGWPELPDWDGAWSKILFISLSSVATARKNSTAAWPCPWLTSSTVICWSIPR